VFGADRVPLRLQGACADAPHEIGEHSVAQKVNVTLVDDLTGEPADESVSFGLDGSGYVIDLSTKNAKSLRDALAPYVASARRDTGRRVRGRSSAAASPNRQRTQEIRAWARKKGIKVSERGRIAADVIAQYESAHKR